MLSKSYELFLCADYDGPIVRSLPTFIGWRATAKLRSQRIFIHQSDEKAAFQSTSVQRNVTVLSNGYF
jgi:hypothetical protein